MYLKNLAVSILPSIVLRWVRDKRTDLQDAQNLRQYKISPFVPPPHSIKVKAVLDYAQRYKLQVLVETGTYAGDMVRKCGSYFREIYTIELDSILAHEAENKFRKKKHIHVVLGDSGDKLPDLLKKIDEPVLFWLDGHFSGGVTAKGSTITPLAQELEAISSHRIKEHVILIDDARLLGKDDYPTENELTSMLYAINPNYTVNIKDDIVRCAL